jgi:hypothetical protein
VAALLRIEAVTLPVPDLGRQGKFYRWVLAMQDAPPASDECLVLGGGKEDRIELIDAATESAEEAVTLRLPAMTVEAAAGWLAERGLAPTTVLVPESHQPDAREAWPEAAVEVAPDADGLMLTVRGRVEPRIDLHIPLPETTTATATTGATGSTGLEVPGLLGVTTGAANLQAARGYLALFGIEPLDPSAEKGPLRVGDQQWIVEEREPAGIYGIAVVIELDRIKDLARTLERLGAEHRHERNRLLALDPAGRILMVHGLKGG